MPIMNNLKDTLIEPATNRRESASGAAEDLQARAQDAWNSVQHGTNRAVRESSAYVRGNPVPTALAVFGFGLVVGLLLHRRQPASFTERNFDEPLHRSRGIFIGLLVGLGALLRRSAHSASGAAEDIAGRFGESLKETVEPLSEAARRTGRKMGL